MKAVASRILLGGGEKTLCPRLATGALIKQLKLGQALGVMPRLMWTGDDVDVPDQE